MRMNTEASAEQTTLAMSINIPGRLKPAEKELPKLSAPYRVAREYRYGRIKVTLYRRDGEETT